MLQCKDSHFCNETFLTVLKTTDSVEELESVKEMVEYDITRQRAKDTGGEDGMQSLSCFSNTYFNILTYLIK